jgi:uncharacterized protein (DUF1778 family)
MPTVAQHPTRSAPISIRFTAKERALIEAAAARAGLTDSDFIRRCALAGVRERARAEAPPHPEGT